MKHIILCTILLCSTASAFSQEWRNLFQETQGHIDNEQYDEALQKATSCLSDYMASDGEANANYAAILRSLVTVTFILEDFEKSVEYGEKELQVRKTSGDQSGEVYAYTLYNLGSAYQMSDQFEKAVQTFTEAIEVFGNILSPDDYELIRVEWKLASSLFYSGKTEEAEARYSNAFDLLQSDEIDNDYLIASYEYANLLVDKGEFSKAGSMVENLVDIYEANNLTSEEVYGQSLKILATSHIVSETDDADKDFEKALNELSKIYSNSPSILSSQLNQWAVLLRDLGKENYSDKILSNLEGDADNDAMSLNNLGTLAFNEGNFTGAADYYVKALQSLDKTNKDDQRRYALIAENMVLLLEAIGKNEEALELQREALDLNKTSDASPQSIAKSESNLARVLKENGYTDESLSFYLSAVKKLPAGSSEIAESLNGLASLYQILGNYSLADSTYSSAFAIIKDKPGRGLAAILNNMGSFYKETGQFLLSRNYFDLAMEQVREVYGDNSLAYSNTLQNLALLDLELGSYPEAEQYISSSLKILENTFGKTHRNYSSALLNYGRIMLAQGKYREAEPAFRQALEIRAQEFNNSGPFYAEALNSMAFFYQTLGNFDEAEPLLEDAIKAFEATGGKNTTNYASSLENLATLYQLLGLYEKAKPLLEEALEIDRRIVGERHPFYSTTLHNLASLYKEVDELDAAQKLFEQALEIDKEVYGTEHPSYAKTLYNLAALHQDKEEYEDAEQLFTEVINIRRKILGENHPEYAYSLYGLASIKRVLEKPEAVELYREALEKYLFQIDEYFPALSEKEKSAFYEKIRIVFESFKDFAVEQALKGNPEVLPMLYDLQLSTKALLLNSSSKIRQRILSSGDDQLIRAFEDWLTLKEKLVKYYSLTLDELESENIDLENLSARANDLEKEISEKSEVFSREVERTFFTWETVKSSLNAGEAAVEIFRIEKTFQSDSLYYAGLVIRPDSDSPELVVFNYGNQLETRMFNYYRNAIKFTVGDEISFANYWTAIEKKLPGIKTVYLSSDGIFNKISYNTLWDYKNDTYVLEEYNVRLVSNTREIAEEHPTDKMDLTNIAAVFGDPDFGEASNSRTSTRASAFGFSAGVPSLPGTRVEVNSLTGSLKSNGWSSKIYVKQDASEDNFKQIESPRLVHIATHGFFMSDIKVEEDSKAFGIHLQNEKANPLFRSGLFFSGSNRTIFGQDNTVEEDGILTAYEAMNLNLDRTELVVMSACETGLGAIKNGEGVYGLQRAFLVAGAKSVIMSLWKVNDETTQMLMNSFYDYWLAGEDKLDAFAKAQLELKNEYPDPYHWGAFVILGY